MIGVIDLSQCLPDLSVISENLHFSFSPSLSLKGVQRHMHHDSDDAIPEITLDADGSPFSK